MDGKDITWSRSLKSAKGRGGLASAKELTSIAEEYQERMRNRGSRAEITCYFVLWDRTALGTAS